MIRRVCEWCYTFRKSSSFTLQMLGAIGFTIFAYTSAYASTDTCKFSVDHYITAQSEISVALRAYSTCMSNSNGHDNCTSEFDRLRAAQDDFAAAVLERQFAC